MRNFFSLCLLTLFIVLPLSSFRSFDEVSDKHLAKVEVKAPVKQEIVTDFISVKATYYNPSFAQCDSTPLVTASGAIIDTTRTTELRWCAISFNLHKRYGGPLDFGDVVEIEGFQGKHKIKGRYIVQDLMNPMWKNKVDILKANGETGITYDSVKLRHKKIKGYKEKVSADAKRKARQVERQILNESIQRFMSKIPFIGTDVLRNENYARVRPEIPLNDKVSPDDSPQKINI